jgi:hypothetical protein
MPWWCDFWAGCGLGGGGDLPKPRIFHPNDSSPTPPEPPECGNAEGRARRAREEIFFYYIALGSLHATRSKKEAEPRFLTHGLRRLARLGHPRAARYSM